MFPNEECNSTSQCIALVESKGEGPSFNIAQCIEFGDGEAKSCVGWFKRRRLQSPPLS